MLEPARITPTIPASARALGKTADTLLCAVGRYPFLTAVQATQLAFSAGSLKYVMDAFSKLTRAGYVVATGRHYGSKSHYVLSARGARHVNDAIGSTVRLWLQPSEIRSKSLQHLLHTSAVNQFLISLELLCRHVSQVRVADVLHDIELKRQPVPVTLPDGTTHTVILDSWVELHIADTWQECLGVEVDRGFYEQKRWREKVRARVAFMKGPYQEYFKTKLGHSMCPL
jgi:Replication-relaxation